ncbi:MAG: amidohydrolase family protein [Thermogutta sp.]|nr:amidohydrolase family protein [Thermogutta sp.]HQF12341.1 amidohydrolase family protein [Thermogutta sp.]
MTSAADLCVTADWILPLDGPPIPNGRITIAGHRIAEIDAGGERVRLMRHDPRPQGVTHLHYKDCVILPGLINAHTHLDLSGWSGDFISPPKLWDWIPEVVRFRRSNAYRPGEAIRDGLQAVLAGGAVGVVDVIPPDWFTWGLVPEQGADPDGDQQMPEWEPSRLRVLSMIECLAPTGRMRIPPEELLQHHAMACRQMGWEIGLSPHAPYTVPMSVLKEVVKVAVDHNATLTMHIAETEEEAVFLSTGGGAFRDMLKHLSAYRDGVFSGGNSLQDVLEVLVQAPRVLLIHGNYLGRSQIDFLCQFRDRLAVVYCPRSHEFFGHTPYPLEQFLEASIPVLLGTDSRASHPDISMLGELQAVRRKHPHIEAETNIRMATSTAANVLGWENDLGNLAVGRLASFTVVHVDGLASKKDPYEAVLSPHAQVCAVWLAGKLAYQQTGHAGEQEGSVA